jgi:hypothetical protein
MGARLHLPIRGQAFAFVSAAIGWLAGGRGHVGGDGGITCSRPGYIVHVATPRHPRRPRCTSLRGSLRFARLTAMTRLT